MLRTTYWLQTGFGRILLTAAAVVILMVLSRHYVPSVHESADKLVAQYAPQLPHLNQAEQTHDEDRVQEESSKITSTPSAATSTAAPAPPLSSKLTLRGCPVIPDSADYLVSMKTGSTELFAKLPEQLLTTLRCVPNYMIFSDLEADVGDYHVYSSLEDVSDKYKYSHRDFEFYRRLLDLSAKGQDLSRLGIVKQAEGSAWDLDKWKFVPIARKVYVEHPEVKWYIFLEADSYMAWANVLEVLALFDPTEPWYLGATHFYGDVAFAHGGMGYVLSNGAMKALDKIWDSKHVAEWERRTTQSCCGDVELAAVLQEAGVNITGIPGLYGESLTWFEWKEGRWCEPALSWHHMKAHDLEALWQFETKWLEKGNTHYAFGDLFDLLVAPHLTATRVDWDNMCKDRIYTGPSGIHGDEGRQYQQKLSWEDVEEDERDSIWEEQDEEQKAAIEYTGLYVKDTRWDELSDEEREAVYEDMTDAEKQAHESVEQCKAACEEWDDCKQYWYRLERCHLHGTLRLGNYIDRPAVESDGAGTGHENRTVAGWMQDRIQSMIDDLETCASVPEWVKEYAEKELQDEVE